MLAAQTVQGFIDGEFSDTQLRPQLTHRRQFAASGQFALFDGTGERFDDLLDLGGVLMKVDLRKGHRDVLKFAGHFTGKACVNNRRVYLPDTEFAP